MLGEQRRIRILHVDDESSFLALTKNFLECETEEFSVDTSTSAEEGLERLKSSNYDVVLSDYQMPTMDGLEFLQKLRERGNTIPFIVFTGRGREEVAITALNKGANRYLQKGVDIESMFATLAYTIKDAVAENRAEKARRESEERYRLLFNKGNDAVFVHEVSTESMPGKIIDVNDVACDILGYTREELLQLSHLDLLAPEELTRVPEIKEKLQANGSNLFEIVGATKYGKRIIFEINNHLFKLDGQPTVLAIARYITERKKAEEELQQSEEMYRTLFENTGTAMMIIEEDMTISHINDEMVTVSGYSKEEIEGRVKWPELVVQDDLERMKGYHRLRRSDPGAAPTSYEFQFTHKRGDIRDAILTAAVIPGTKKSVISIKDITDRKQMENELLRSESLYRTLFEATGVPTVILDEAGLFYQVNAEGVKISGFPKEELEGKKSWTEFIATQEDLERMREIHLLRRAEPDNAPMNYEFLFRDRYGNLRNIYVTAAIIPGTKKSVVSFLDITERKRAEEELREREKAHQMLLDSVPVSIFHIDSNGTFVHVNEALAKQYGLKPGDFKGKSSRDLFPEVAEEYIKSDCEVLESGEPQIGSIRRINTPQGVRWVRLDKVPLKDDDGHVTGIIGFELDVTERKQADEERKRLLEELEAKNRELEHFTYMVSHDLRSPLVTIQGFAAMLQKDLEQDAREKAKTDLLCISKAATKMDDFLSDTLELSRIGRIANPPEDVPFGDIARDALEQTAGELKANNVAVSIAEDFPTVHIDRVRIAEALVNLITNSIKYRGEQHQPKIELGYRVEGGETVFFVKDNASGLTKASTRRSSISFIKWTKMVKEPARGLQS